MQILPQIPNPGGFKSSLPRDIAQGAFKKGDGGLDIW